MASVTTIQRIDLKPIKLQIQHVLKEKANEYWDVLRRYTLSRVSKRELDKRCQALLGNHVMLHNWLVLGILSNAHITEISAAMAAAQCAANRSPSPSPKGTPNMSSILPLHAIEPMSISMSSDGQASPSQKKKKRKAGKALDDVQIRKVKKRKTSSGMPMSPIYMDGEARGIKTPMRLSNLFATSLTAAPPVMSPFMLTPRVASGEAGYARDKFMRSLRANSLLHRKPLLAPASVLLKPRPGEVDKRIVQSATLTALRQKMIRLAHENGLSAVSDKSVLLMYHAVTTHMKDILNQCTPRLRGVGVLREASPTHIRNLNAHNTIQSFSRMRPDVIYTKDLMIAVDLTPHLFSENLIANQERLGVLQ